MPFSQATITDVALYREDADLALSWVATGLGPYQVYVDRILTWHGTETSCLIPWPAEPNTPIDIGAVDPGEEEIDFSASLPPAPASHVTLAWQGGTYEGADLAGFRVYQGQGTTSGAAALVVRGLGLGGPLATRGLGAIAVAGPAIDFTRPVAEITAYPIDIYTDGWGDGGWGEGGWGASASNYTWRSGTLGRGSWNFAVKPFDAAGNEGPAQLASAALAVPPRPPAVDAYELRLRYTYNPSTRVATLTWLPSPS